MRAAVLPAALALAGAAACAHYTTSSSRAPTEVGRSGLVPTSVVTGEATALYFLKYGPFGDDSEEKAGRRARGRALEASLSDVTVEHRVSCFPTCEHALFMTRTTVVTGSLLAPTRYLDPEAPRPQEASIDLLSPTPSAETLCRRFEGLYREGQSSAKEFYDSLDAQSRQLLRDHLLSSKGVRSSYSQEFRLPKDSSPEERKFLEWFLAEYTDYKPVIDDR